jgi:predicted lipoprotein with Yx(FWY)xxD motif
MTRRTAVTLALMLLVAAAVATAAIATSGASSAATVKTRSTSLGTILVDAKGRTLYLFEKDRAGKSACTGACAKNWPPTLTKGKPTAGGKAVKAKLGTTKRADGTTQVTYGGHPLYTFVIDAGKPGSTKGEAVKAFGAEWYVVGTTGKKIEKPSSASGSSGSSGSGYSRSGY